MRRFCLLFLVFLLPLQMSWAAVHFCEQEAPTRISASALAAEQPRQGQDGLSDDKTGTLADACCCGPAGCQGLQSLVAPTTPAPRAISDRSAIPDQDQRRASSPMSTRHERPKWLAA